MIPKKINSLFSEERFTRLKECLVSQAQSSKWDSLFGRKSFLHWDQPLLSIYNNFLIAPAREIFNSNSLIPTYSQYIEYSGNTANLFHHVDNNACTYTISVLIHHNTPWGFWVEGEEFMMEPNEAVAYFGNDQEHWREEFPNPESNVVGMALFHFAEPDHWYFSEGPEHVFNIINKQNGIM
jgi:hypothetical protein